MNAGDLRGSETLRNLPQVTQTERGMVGTRIQLGLMPPKAQAQSRYAEFLQVPESICAV